MWWRSVIFIGIAFGLIMFIIPHVIWLLSWIIGRITLILSKGVYGFNLGYRYFLLTATGLMVLTWLVVAYGHYIGRFQSVVTEVEYSSGACGSQQGINRVAVPSSFNGFKIVHISDLHVDSFDENPKALQKILDRVNAQNADIILFTGDMTTAGMENIRLHEKALRSLKSKYGVVSVMGNHDFFIYCPEYTNDMQRCAAADRLTTYERHSLGWTVLRNESLMLHRGNDSIAIAGVDNINGNQGFRTIQRGDLKKAINGLDGIFTVLLTHDPSHWEAEVLPKSNVQITLSGHTHAAQMRLFGWSLANLAFKECDGRYDHNGRMLYVNAGIGCTAPFRIDCPAEITVITLKTVE